MSLGLLEPSHKTSDACSLFVCFLLGFFLLLNISLFTNIGAMHIYYCVIQNSTTRISGSTVVLPIIGMTRKKNGGQ